MKKLNKRFTKMQQSLEAYTCVCVFHSFCPSVCYCRDGVELTHNVRVAGTNIGDNRAAVSDRLAQAHGGGCIF